MNIKPYDVRRLLQDPAFSAILDKVRADQCAIFLNTTASEADAREEAYAIAQATYKIEQALQAILTEEAMQERKTKRK